MNRFTVQEFWKFIQLPENQDKKFELIDGVITRRPGLTMRTGMIKSMIAGELYNFLQTVSSGVSAISVDHYLPQDWYNTRRPEISYFSSENAKLLDDDDYASIMPDLAIEVKSPNNTYKELREKAAYYLKHGSRMVWNFIPEKEETHIYTLDETGINVVIVKKSGILTGGDVLPGFALPLTKVFKGKA